MWTAIFDAGRDLGIAACGLKALVSLRMEKKYPLYGLDLTEETSPIEAGLGWTIKFGKGSFVGKETLAAQKLNGTRRKLVQLVFATRGVDVRAGDDVRHGGKTVGALTSVAEGITVGKTLALGYVSADVAEQGVEVTVEAAGGRTAARVGLAPIYDPERRRVLDKV